jgi:hypothetical protein
MQALKPVIHSDGRFTDHTTTVIVSYRHGIGHIHHRVAAIGTDDLLEIVLGHMHISTNISMQMQATPYRAMQLIEIMIMDQFGMILAQSKSITAGAG